MNRWRSFLVAVAFFGAGLLFVGQQKGRSQSLTPTYSQSSIYSPTPQHTGSVSNLNDANASTGAGTGSGASWIQADLGTATQVSSITLGGGTLSGWGATAGYLSGSTLQYSTDGQSWTTLLTISGMSDSGAWVVGGQGTGLFKQFTFSPVTARYWRISKSGYLATTEFRFNEPLPVALSNSFTASQSSTYGSVPVATYANLNDSSLSTGTGTSSSSSSWIQTDFGSAIEVAFVTLGGGRLAGWGSISGYLNSAALQYSSDGQSWATALTVSGVVDTDSQTFVLNAPISARYWRIFKSGYIATSEFRFSARSSPAPSPYPRTNA
jgi:hypothetical protein